MNQFRKDFITRLLKVCEKVESLALKGIMQGLYQPTDFYPYITNLKHELMCIKTDDGIKSYYGNWGVQEINILIKQVCGKVCACDNGSLPITLNKCHSCPIFCYRNSYGSDEEVLF